MEDISELVNKWDAQNVIGVYKENPITIKSMKIKLQKIYMISSYNQREYLPDVIDAWAIIKFVAQYPNYQIIFQNEKTSKHFIQEFIYTCIKYMILCKSFKLLEMMIYTQQMMVQGLRVFSRFFDQLQKFPRMTLILKYCFQFQKMFFRTNYTNPYHYLIIPPTQQQIDTINNFIKQLKSEDKVDILKTQHQSKRMCWLPGVFKKSSTSYIYVRCDHQKSGLTIDHNSLLVRPRGSMKQHYQWRINLKIGDRVDYYKDMTNWIRTQIQQIRQLTDPADNQLKYIQVKVKDDDQYWISITDPKLQKQGSITKMRCDGRQQKQFYFDDYNDYVFDPNMTQTFITRSDTTKCMLSIDLLKYFHNQLNLFDRIAKTIKQKSMKIQVIADLISFVLFVQPLFHRQFAVSYLTQLTKDLFDYINNSKQGTIRNFSKERYDAVIHSLQEFMKRLYPSTQRNQKIEKLKLDLILRFLFSDFLDRKLQSITLLTQFFKRCAKGITKKPLKQLVKWIKENKILANIYNEKSHSQLIAKSSDFLKYYIETQPSNQQLQCLLIWNQAILKLVNQNFEDLPQEIKNTIVEKIKNKQNVTNSDALSIIKKTPNCQAWLLQNGGQCWVQVVREKTKRKAEIAEVFKQPFPVVNKITKEMNEMYESSFKNTYFSYMFEINYLCTILENEEIDLSQKLQFIRLATELIKKITDPIFELLLKFLINNNLGSELSQKYQQFFIKIMPKLQISHLKKLLQQKFSKKQQLENMSEAEFLIFKRCFIEANHNIEEHKQTEHSFGKRITTHFFVLRGNIQQLFAIDRYEWVIFHTLNSQISKNAIIFLGDLLSSTQDTAMASKYTNKLLQTALQQLYNICNEQNEQKALIQQNCLRIIKQIMNLTQKKGVDEVPSVHALFPLQKILIKLTDNFNTTRSKVHLQVLSNMTLYQFRSELCKNINAYVHQTKLLINGNQLNARYNGHLIHNLQLQGDITIDKVSQIPRISLVDNNGNLVQKAKIVFKNIFTQYSSFGLMSKKQCLKYHQKCVGQVMSQGQAKVDKIYDQFDKDRDGYLTQNDFISFYEISSKTKQHSVWSNLQAFGVRNDLQILDTLPIVYPDRNTLARSKLYDDDKFMTILFQLLASQNNKLALQAWKLAARLPLYQKFDVQLDLSKQYLTRYWLHIRQNKKQYNKITKQILSQILKMSIQTVCIGLKVTLQCQNIDIDIFNIIIDNLKNINTLEHIDFCHKVILEYSLKIFSKFIIKNQVIAQYYITNYQGYNKIFRDGIMSKNIISRQKFCNTLSQLQISETKNFKLFQCIFNLIYRIFDNYQLSTLTMQYFQLFSNLLTVLRQRNTLMQKLQLNWGTLTQQIINIYKSHQCTQTSMTSKPDQVAQGLLKIIAKLLNDDTIDYIVDLVPFIFQQSLFPQKGRNKLKTSKSRQDAYQLIYQICKYQKNDGKLSGGLQKLFNAGFKQIYKKMSTKKVSEPFSYFYSYNQSRSQLGYAGIRNLGCICYMISMLQQFYMTTPFRNLILMANDNQPQCLVKKGSKEIDDNLFHQLKNMFSYLLLTQKQQYNPDQFCFSFKDFQGLPVNTSVQQDAQQFLNIFFDKLQTSLKNTPFKHIFDSIYGGKSCSQMTCSGCGVIKQRTQNFYNLSLEIKGYKNINQSFKKYIQGQVISDYQCDSCQNKCNVIKRNFLQKTPNYFIIHLQRMCFNYDRLQNEKVNTRWQFPHQLNVYNYTLSKQKQIDQINKQFSYKLRGIVVHYGTADFGHYFSYIRQSDTQWIEFNDQRVRQFDPSDIEVECFGGQHWRRQSQSAYLLVYERQYKSNVVLEFTSQDEKRSILQQFKLTQAVIQDTQQNKNQSESRVSKQSGNQQIMSQTNLSKQKQQQVQLQTQKQTQTQKSQKQTQNNNQIPKQVPKCIVNLDIKKIGQFVPKKIKDKIDQQNDEFSFTMNLSNNQFALFIYHILSINPPQSLRQQYLQLCYQCLHLKQTIKIQTNKIVHVSQWANERFSQLISGHGWDFLKNFSQNLQIDDMFHIQKSIRHVNKCILQSVILDIIKSNNFDTYLQQTEINQNQQPQRQQKRLIVIKFLNQLLGMMMSQAVKHWTRFAQYFEIWTYLVKQSKFVRRYCQQKMIVQKLLQFIMQQSYPFQKSGKRIQMGNQYYKAQFQYPLQLLHTLLQNGYQLNQMQIKCFKTYGFMDKIICHRVQGANIIQMLCKNNNIISQKMGFLLLKNCSQVQQSDQVKPIISSIHQYLKIDDNIKHKRLQWIIGFPSYIEHTRQKGFGSYGCIPSNQPAVNFISALGYTPILQQILKFRKKSQHVAALLISMILQLQHDGFINNLQQLPSKMAVERTYTSQFENFINSYYQDTQRPYTPKSYNQYGLRIKTLWEERPNRPFKNSFPKILLGKIIQQKLIKQQNIQQIFDIKQYDYKIYYLPLDNQETRNLTGKNIVTIKNNDKFVCANLPKVSKPFGHYSIIRLNSSDEQDNQQAPQSSIFDAVKQGWLLRKIQITNKSSQDMLLVFGIQNPSQINLNIPIGPLSAEIQSNSKSALIFIKKDFEKDFGELNITFNILDKATASGFMPQQIITEVDERGEYNKAATSDDEDNDDDGDNL